MKITGDLMEIVKRSERPEPWAEGEKIPWNDPDFSRRMLEEHLSQQHDWASRRAVTIRKHVDWIQRVVLSSRPSRILDLGCGPGLYTSRLADLGNTCTGVDFSPASIAYARESAQNGNRPCSYFLGDIREVPFELGYDLVMFIYGECNVFTSADLKRILKKAHAALSPGGSLLLEAHTFELVRKIGTQPSSWYSAGTGLFSDRPHLCLQENFWHEDQCATTQRYFIVDAQSGQVTRFAASMQAYHPEQFGQLLADCGFDGLVFYPSLLGEDDPLQPGMFAIQASKEL